MHQKVKISNDIFNLSHKPARSKLEGKVRDVHLVTSKFRRESHKVKRGEIVVYLYKSLQNQDFILLQI